jgi:hypothetical protein
MASDTRTKPPLGESDAHAISRHLRVVIRILLIVATVATILLFLFYRPATYLAAIPIPVLILVLTLVNELERRSRASALRHQGQTSITKEELEEDVQTVGIATALKIGGALALGTFIVAGSLFDLATVGIGATALLLLAILIEIPYLGLFITETERDELEKVRPQTHPSRSSADSDATSE